MTDGTMAMEVSKKYQQLVVATSQATDALVAEGELTLATIELLRTLNTGIAGLIMLQEGQLNATAMLVDVTLRGQET